MMKLDYILKKCSWKISQENGDRYFIRCYSCDGLPKKAKETHCPYYTTNNVYRRHISHID